MGKQTQTNQQQIYLCLSNMFRWRGNEPLKPLQGSVQQRDKLLLLTTSDEVKYNLIAGLLALASWQQC